MSVLALSVFAVGALPSSAARVRRTRTKPIVKVAGVTLSATPGRSPELAPAPTVPARSAAPGAAPVAPPAAPVTSSDASVPSAPVPAPASRPIVIDAARAARLQAILDTWTKSQPDLDAMTVGLSVGGASWQGAARRDGARPPDPADVYRVMSITKTFTSVLVFRAVAAGKLRLDGPLPSIDGVNAPVPDGITVRRLLAHRSGLADYTEAPGYAADQPMTPERAVELSLRAPLVSTPGTATRYVNSNYLLLGLLLQQVEHRPYGALIAELASSAGLSVTHLDPPDRPGWAGFASGGIMSNVAEMAQWGEALFTPNRIVPSETFREMSTTGDLDGGLGLWGVCPCTDGASGPDRFTAMGHFTAAGGMFFFPRHHVTLVMRAEPASGDTMARAVALERALAAELVD